MAKSNSLLVQAKTKLEEAVPPKYQKSYAQIIVAGMKLMWSDTTHRFMSDYMDKITDPATVPQRIAHGIVKMISVIVREAKIKADIKDPFYAASMIAAQVLMVDALEYLEQKKKIPISSEILAETTKMVTTGLFKLYGITEHLAKQAAMESQKVQAGTSSNPMAPPPMTQGA